MSLDIVVAGLIMGLLVGLTGSGGGALLTPVLILLFGVTPSAAISNDIVASAIMRPIGGAIHVRKGTVQTGLVLWLSVGSVPAAFAGAFIDHAFGTSKAVEQNLEYATGAAVILAVAAMAVKMVMDAITQKNAGDPEQPEPAIKVKRVRTVAIGVFGGLLVGIISVGAGSLMIVLLMMLYPRMSMRRLVGTDIVAAAMMTRRRTRAARRPERPAPACCAAASGFDQGACRITASSVDQVSSFRQFSDGIDGEWSILKPDAAQGGTTCGCIRQQRDTASAAEGP